MAETINLGTTANDGTGDTLRVAGEKINNNFALPHFGCWIYGNTGSAQVCITLLLENNGLGSNTNIAYGLTSITNIWNASENEFDFSDLQLGDKVSISIDVDFETTENNQFVKLVQILSHTETDEKRIPYASNIFLPTPTSMQSSFYVEFLIDTESVKNNASKIEFQSNDDCSVILEKITIFVHKRTI